MDTTTMKEEAARNKVPQFDLKVFVVPNPSINYSLERLTYYQIKQFTDSVVDASRFGINAECCTLSSKWIQVWIHGMGCDNMTDHGMPDELRAVLPEVQLTRHTYLAPYVLPEEFLKDAKEGAVKTTFVKKWNSSACDYDVVAEINWHFEQLPYRYGRFGKFEEVVKYVTSHKVDPDRVMSTMKEAYNLINKMTPSERKDLFDAFKGQK